MSVFSRRGKKLSFRISCARASEFQRNRNEMLAERFLYPKQQNNTESMSLYSLIKTALIDMNEAATMYLLL